MSFRKALESLPLTEYDRRVRETTDAEVDDALAAATPGFDEYLALLSPAAGRRLEDLARRAEALTRERFGRVMQFYAPVYVSNECTNACRYCGFQRTNEIRRTTLSPAEVELEADALWRQGFRNLLLVSGEAPRTVSVSYFEEVAERLHGRFPALSVEIYPLERADYARLVSAGIDGLTVFQETYDPALYATMHPTGRKRDYGWRLEAPSRGAAAGMRRIGLGALLGLGPWRREAIALALHALWLQKVYWRAQVSVAFPRLRAAPGGFDAPCPMTDPELVQFACALRLLLPDAGLNLSTRERPEFRDGLARICITQMSAGSRTEPGGYSRPGESDGQFQVEDGRSPGEVAAVLLAQGLEPVWKDWDCAFSPLPLGQGEARFEEA